VEETISRALYRDVVVRVINTMANSFFQSQDLLTRIAKNQGVDAQISLRDNLKAYASKIQTKLSL